MPSQLEVGLEAIITVFHQYAIKIGDRYMMSNKEVTKLLENELSDILEIPRDPEWVDKIMRDLDEDPDGQLNFNEFVKLLATILINIEPSFSEET